MIYFYNTHEDIPDHIADYVMKCADVSDIRKLKKKLQKENFFNEIRKREFFETRNEKRRKEIAASTRRCIRKREKLEKLEV